MESPIPSVPTAPTFKMPCPQSQMAIYLLETGLLSNSDLSFGPNTICIASTPEEAYEYFFSRDHYAIDNWEYDQERLGGERNYDSLSKEEKQQVHRSYCEHYERRVHSFPLVFLEGIKHLLSPFQEEIVLLHRENRVESLRRVVSTLREGEVPIPDEIIDIEIKKHL